MPHALGSNFSRPLDAADATEDGLVATGLFFRGRLAHMESEEVEEEDCLAVDSSEGAWLSTLAREALSQASGMLPGERNSPSSSVPLRTLGARKPWEGASHPVDALRRLKLGSETPELAPLTKLCSELLPLPLMQLAS